MSKPILVMAVGNESRGDDALGPLLGRRLENWLEHTGASQRVEVIEEFQLQVENTLDLHGREGVLFVDAGHQTFAPFSFYEARPKRLAGHTTHAVAPETLLGIYADVQHAAAPPAFILCIAGIAFELGEPLSPQAVDYLEHAAAFCRQLFENPDVQVWRDRTTEHQPIQGV